MTDTKALAFTLPTNNEWEIIKFQSETLFASGLLPKHIKNEKQAIAIVLKGRELDVPPWTALTKIHVIEGVPTVAPELMLALIKRSGLADDIKIDGPDDIKKHNACSVTMKRHGESPHTTTFSMEDANRQGLTGKYNWKKMPHVMLKWRAVSDCARTVFPDVVSGLYTPEEINPDATIDYETGEIIDGEVEEQQNIAPDAAGRPETSAAEEQAQSHWIDDGKVRAKFWAYVKNDADLTEQEVYEALGVASVHDFEGSMHDARALIDSYAEMKRLDADADADAEPLFPDAETA